MRDRPNSLRGHHGLGRGFTDAGQFDQAIAAAGKGNPNHINEAKKRLAQMAGGG